MSAVQWSTWRMGPQGMDSKGSEAARNHEQLGSLRRPRAGVSYLSQSIGRPGVARTMGRVKAICMEKGMV